jgi:hypothetical protein
MGRGEKKIENLACMKIFTICKLAIYFYYYTANETVFA